MPRMTPFITPTKESRSPKSVVSVMIGGTRRPPRSAVAADHEVSDERQGLLVLAVLERAEVLLGRLGVGLGPLKRVVHALVLDHEPPDLLELGRRRGAAREHR